MILIRFPNPDAERKAYGRPPEPTPFISHREAETEGDRDTADRARSLGEQQHTGHQAAGNQTSAEIVPRGVV